MTFADTDSNLVANGRQLRGALNIEALYQAVFDEKIVGHHFVQQQIAFEIADDLMNLYQRRTIHWFADMDGINVWINRRPLARPILPNGFVTMNVPPVHTVRPRHVVGQCRKNAVYISRIEALVKVLD